jgi:transcriptional regulator NrdR family protein
MDNPRSTKCPICGVWTDQTSVRTKSTTGEPLPYRRREYRCGNEHRFATYEITSFDLHGTDVASRFNLRTVPLSEARK